MERVAVDTALQLAMHVSPTGKEQIAFTHMCNNMRADGRTTKEVVVGLTEAMLDGLKHGNWPKPEGV